MRGRATFLALVATGLAVAAAWGLRAAGPEAAPEEVGRAPRLTPDVAGCVIPPNLAPLNVRVDEPGARWTLTVEGGGEALTVTSGTPAMHLPAGGWRRLLEAAAGGEVTMSATVEGHGGRRRRFRPVRLGVATEPIDPYLAYRLIGPVYNGYRHMGIYERDLRTFAERTVLDGRSFGGYCCNCHSTCRNRPDPMSLQVRSASGLPMLVLAGGEVRNVSTRGRFSQSPAAYTSWHPSGALCAFSVNRLSLVYHAVGETRDVHDAASDLGVYYVEDNLVSTAPALADPDRLESWPGWSHDGRHLYYASAPRVAPERLRENRYDLVRIPFDLETRTWGAPETLVSAAETGTTAIQPRPSPQGRWVVYCRADYGNFTIYSPSSDLWVYDLTTGETRRLEASGDACDSWHSWSSNGRWLAFASKRDDGVYTRVYLSYFDADGRSHPPVVLPQEDPAFYGRFLKCYNVPELMVAPIPARTAELAKAICEPHRRMVAETDAPACLLPPPDAPPAADPRERTFSN